MKRTLIALAMGLASTAAFANTGNINFHGTITPGGTCPIEVVMPGTGGSILPQIGLGSYPPSYFGSTAGKQTPARTFALRIDPDQCTINPGTDAYVTFSAVYGPEGSNLYALKPYGAAGVALAIQDKSLSNLAPGRESVAYPLKATQPNEMLFHAMYESTGTVTDGDAASEVRFSVDIR
ncbi:fimbrial protein [Pseudomonas putida]|uniref:fimbrial protein n=1 Tax=Pseudomonas putida TaxID=303 RepID=UPI001575F7D8|nr:fimbrial protein [Pseudomonas putida]NTY91385.1 type 1 fimbrial protein [Pseudomonas putida]NTZ02933.1 type 1 fimbrial protein [Pseudomonas putida]NTZ24285.1 type 1 fimbrial protein [Pseudomonas putida]NTZ57167.1 type 1 fimbrial protein [Pseudomonas putida]NTZ67688.1 type 1 fimbrial protein [Pseudomonas putida]